MHLYMMILYTYPPDYLRYLERIREPRIGFSLLDVFGSVPYRRPNAVAIDRQVTAAKSPVRAVEHSVK